MPREKDFERQVKNGIVTPGIVVSVSGPSKSGKSVLVQVVAGKDNLIHVFGAQIKSPDELWGFALDWMDSPTTRTTQGALSNSSTSSGGGSFNVGIPGAIGGGVSGSQTQMWNETNTSTITKARGGLAQVAREIGSSPYVLFIDDFHYMPRDLQAEVAKQLKAGAEFGIKSCVANVPHRADDVVRANPELRGRVQAVDMEYWSNTELEKIGLDGFPHLNINVADNFIHQLAVEACGSPQLMQALCLQTCFTLNVYETLEYQKHIAPTSSDYTRILASTATLADSSTMVETLHGGPKTHGMDRNQYKFFDGSEGDVYRAVMLAVASDPPTMSMPYRDIVSRVAAICLGKSPNGRNISDACEQISKLAAKGVRSGIAADAAAPIEWDKTTEPENLHVVEPYFLFYLRSSPILKTLGRRAASTPEAAK